MSKKNGVVRYLESNTYLGGLRDLKGYLNWWEPRSFTYESAVEYFWVLGCLNGRSDLSQDPTTRFKQKEEYFKKVCEWISENEFLANKITKDLFGDK